MAVSEAEAIEAGARPLEYFGHDANASADIKCRRLIRRLGVEGYGRWWLLCELLASADWHRLDVSDEEGMELVADALRCDVGEAASFLATLGDIGLVDAGLLGDGVVSSDRMCRNALAVGRKRAGGKLGGRPRKDR